MVSPLPRLDLFPDSARVAADGHLHLAGLDVMRLAEEFGTPLYLYDAATLRARLCAYREALSASYPAAACVAYAAKAFFCTAVAQWVAAEGLDLDVVSGGELYVALHGGVPAARIHFHGNAKSPEELAFALEAGVGRIVVDNAYELELLSHLAAQRKMRAAIWLRLSPNVDAHTHAYRKTGLLDSKFGFPLATGDALRAAAVLWRTRTWRWWAFMRTWARRSSRQRPSSNQSRCFSIWRDLQEEGAALEELSPGGGWGVRYVESDPPAPIEPYVRAVSAAVAAGCQARGLSLPRLVLEPGRSLVGPAGVAVYTVGARKEIPDVRTYLSVDGGMADNIRPALYGASYTALLANRADQPPTETVTIAGKFCESGDLLIRDLTLPHAEPGDLLAVPVSGAYNLAMSSNYNLALRPAAVWLEAGTARPSCAVRPTRICFGGKTDLIIHWRTYA
jgi:diaminopimelate decarboxylase